MKDDYVALEIKTPELAEIAYHIDPSLREMNYEHELKGNFLVLGFPTRGRTTLVLPLVFRRYFDHIENGSTITLKRFVRKPEIEVDPLRKTQFTQNDE